MPVHFSLKKNFISAHQLQQPQEDRDGQQWFVFQKGRLLVGLENNHIIYPVNELPEECGSYILLRRFLGNYDGRPVYVADLDAAFSPKNPLAFVNLRKFYGVAENDLFILAGKAAQALHWHQEHLFCGKCGTAMQSHETELVKHCPRCGFVSFPRLSPAVIMSVIRGNEILLARAPHFIPGIYSTLAGFVEPGETLEEAVSREVLEETNIEVTNVRYVASQPWPFPHSLMIGFAADYMGGELQLDPRELEDAGWFTVANLPQLPSKITIARLLIDQFINSQK